MFFSFTRRKVVSLGIIALALVLIVYATFAFKSEHYGKSRFEQIFSRLIRNAEQQAAYYVRTHQFDGAVPRRKEIARSMLDTASAQAIPVLTYHAIIPSKDAEEASPESFEGHNVDLTEFEDQMFTLYENGWKTITLEEFDAFMRGERALHEKSFLITFDDGAKESYYPVDPLFKALGYTGVLFVLPEYSRGAGTTYYLSAGEIQRAIRSGRFEVGSHSYALHRFGPIDGSGATGAALSRRLWLPNEQRIETVEEYRTRITDDVRTSRSMLEDLFKVTVDFFAFPFGDFGQLASDTPEARALIRTAVFSHFRYAFYQWWESNGFSFNYPEDKPSMVKRISVEPTWTGAHLLEVLTNGLPKPLPYHDDFTRDHGWLSLWGDYAIANGVFTIKAAPNESGASAILDGTKHWTNYAVRIEAESPTQTGVSIFIRFRDTQNFAVCNLGKGFAHIEQTIDGVSNVIKGNRSDTFTIPEGPFSIDVTVNGRSVSCSMNGRELVATKFLDQSLAYGGVGVKVWDSIIGKSITLLDSMTVQSLNDE